MIAELFLLSIVILYLLFIVIITIGWVHLLMEQQKSGNSLHNADDRISVIIPFRNEESNLKELLERLSVQSFDLNRTEIILINDNSDDSSEEVAASFANKFPNFQVLNSTGTGKKEAVKTGVLSSKCNILLFTDADVLPGRKWIYSMYSRFYTNASKIALGPVAIAKSNNIFQNMESLEFSSLISSNAGASYYGWSFMGNAANMMVEKKVWLESMENSAGKKLSSGDDVFLIHAVRKQFGGKAISFVSDYGALVSTLPHLSVKSFLRQRIRWAGKSKSYKDAGAIITALLIFLMNLSILGGIVLFCLNGALAGLLPLLVKIVIDYPLLRSFNRHFRQKVMWTYLLLQLLYPFYIILTGFLSFFVKVEWKGRKIR